MPTYIFGEKGTGVYCFITYITLSLMLHRTVLHAHKTSHECDVPHKPMPVYSHAYCMMVG